MEKKETLSGSQEWKRRKPSQEARNGKEGNLVRKPGMEKKETLSGSQEWKMRKPSQEARNEKEGNLVRKPKKREEGS